MHTQNAGNSLSDDTEEEGKKSRVNVERSTAGTKKCSPEWQTI